MKGSQGQLLILGAGAAGLLAASALRSYQPRIIEKNFAERAGLAGHRAVMRLRDPAVGLLLGCDLQEITVHKAALFKRRLYSEANITINNLYSRKVSNSYSEKSILELGKAKRYIFNQPLPRPSGVEWGMELEAVCDSPRTFLFKGKKQVSFGIGISTLPLPVLLAATGLDSLGQVFKTYSIWVGRAKLKVPCTLHQTIYIPEPEYAIYRATLEGQEIILEAMSQPLDSEVEEVLGYFGLYISDYSLEVIWEEQKNGKLIPIDDDVRRFLLMELTRKFGIYSFGRYAIWRQLRLDHLLQDIEKIKRMLRVSEVQRQYCEKLGD